MILAKTYEAISPAVVAFISKHAVSRNGELPLAPSILGTGFLIHNDGIVVTNRHVVDVVEALPRDPRDNSCGAAILMMVTGQREERRCLRWAVIEIWGHTTLGSFGSTGPWYGESVPDVGFVQLKVRETPALTLATEDYYVRTGMPIATAGFPMGTEPLTVMDKLNQITPFLRRGIVSSVYPFGIPQPHGFTIDIMQQGGSSGSPIFREQDPVVVGMMASSVIEHSIAQGDGLILQVAHNTNISIAIPSPIIGGALEQFRKESPWRCSDLPALEEHLANKPMSPQIGWEILGGTCST